MRRRRPKVKVRGQPGRSEGARLRNLSGNNSMVMPYAACDQSLLFLPPVQVKARAPRSRGRGPDAKGSKESLPLGGTTQTLRSDAVSALLHETTASPSFPPRPRTFRTGTVSSMSDAAPAGTTVFRVHGTGSESSAKLNSSTIEIVDVLSGWKSGIAAGGLKI